MKRKGLGFKAIQGMVFVLLLLFLAACGNSDEEPVEDVEVEDEVSTEEELEAEPEEDSIAMRDDEDFGERVEIVDVINGDTIVVEGENGTETVQLALIDTPDRLLPDGSEDQKYGLAAYEYSKYELLARTGYRLERSEVQNHPEGYTLGFIWAPDGSFYESINLDLVLRGYARVDREAGAHPELLERLEEAETSSRTETEGFGDQVNSIWSVDGYVTEDGFDPSVL